MYVCKALLIVAYSDYVEPISFLVAEEGTG
jgi:hypothetical protein